MWQGKTGRFPQHLSLPSLFPLYEVDKDPLEGCGEEANSLIDERGRIECSAVIDQKHLLCPI